jgi:hypothetical protein
MTGISADSAEMGMPFLNVAYGCEGNCGGRLRLPRMIAQSTALVISRGRGGHVDRAWQQRQQD